MWPFKKKIVIKEHSKVYPYSRMRNNKSNYSVWDNLSIVEKFAMFMLPTALTFIDYMITDAIFGFPKWLTACIAIGSTIFLLIFLNLFITWLTERDY